MTSGTFRTITMDGLNERYDLRIIAFHDLSIYAYHEMLTASIYINVVIICFLLYNDLEEGLNRKCAAPRELFVLPSFECHMMTDEARSASSHRSEKGRHHS